MISATKLLEKIRLDVSVLRLLLFRPINRKTMPANVARQANIAPPSICDRRINRLSGVKINAPIRARSIPNCDCCIGFSILGLIHYAWMMVAGEISSLRIMPSQCSLAPHPTIVGRRDRIWMDLHCHLGNWANLVQKVAVLKMRKR